MLHIFGLICCLCLTDDVSVESTQPQNTSVKFVMTQALGERECENDK